MTTAEDVAIADSGASAPRLSRILGPIAVALALLSAAVTFAVLAGLTPLAPTHQVVVTVLAIDALAALLLVAWNDEELRAALWSALPVAGVNGTLEDRMQRAPARGAVRAKTGTTEHASALAGYVRDRFVFAVLQNGWPVSSWSARKAQDRFATALASAS
jgi:hypothetical protein